MHPEAALRSAEIVALMFSDGTRGRADSSSGTCRSSPSACLNR